MSVTCRTGPAGWLKSFHRSEHVRQDGEVILTKPILRTSFSFVVNLHPRLHNAGLCFISIWVLKEPGVIECHSPAVYLLTARHSYLVSLSPSDRHRRINYFLLIVLKVALFTPSLYTLQGEPAQCCIRCY